MFKVGRPAHTQGVRVGMYGKLIGGAYQVNTESLNLCIFAKNTLDFRAFLKRSKSATYTEYLFM